MYPTTAHAKGIVATVAHLLTNSEQMRMRASLEIDLSIRGQDGAKSRAVQSLWSKMTGYAASPSRDDWERLRGVDRIFQTNLVPEWTETRAFR